MRHTRGHVLRAEGDGQGPIRFVAATEGRKADGIDLQMDRVDLIRFRENPVILFAHDYWSPAVGRSVGERVDGGRLLIDVEFDRDDPLGESLDRKYRGGFMSAVSVGFDVFGLDDQTGVPERWQLLELSAVPVGLDPDALKDAGRSGLAAVRSILSDERRRLAGHPDVPPPSPEPEPCPDCAGRAAQEAAATPKLDAARSRLLDHLTA